MNYYNKNKPTKKAIKTNLEMMILKNPHLKTLIQTFGLEQIIKQHINPTKKTEKTMSKFSKGPQATETKEVENSTTFPQGINFNGKKEGSPDFVVGSIYLKPDLLISWLEKNPNLLHQIMNEKTQSVEAVLKLDVLLSKEKQTPYLKVNDYGLGK